MYTKLCSVKEIPANGSRAFDLNGQSVLICHSDERYFAIENRCTHQNTPLDGGRVRRGYVSCPLHGMRFNLQNGEPVGQLTRIPVRTFPVRVDGDAIHVDPDGTGTEPDLGE